MYNLVKSPKRSITNAECNGGDVSGIEGIVTSPNYPNIYDSSMGCQWTFNAPEGQVNTDTDVSNCIVLMEKYE